MQNCRWSRVGDKGCFGWECSTGEEQALRMEKERQQEAMQLILKSSGLAHSAGPDKSSSLPRGAESDSVGGPARSLLPRHPQCVDLRALHLLLQEERRGSEVEEK